MQISSIEKNFLFILLLIVIVITILILYPFLTMFVVAVAFAVVLNPIYLWIKKHLVRNKSWLASFLTIIIFLLCLCIPVFFIGKEVVNQIQNLYINIIGSGNSSHFIESINSSINDFLPAGFNFDIYSKITEFVSSLLNNLAGLFSSTLNSIMMFVLMIFSIFYLLKNGKEWKEKLIKLIPLSENNGKEIISSLNNSINRTLKGTFFIAIVQGILSWLGLWVFGVPNAVLWGVVAGLASLIPSVGTSVVSVPAILFLYFTGMKFQALGLLAWAALLVGMIDNLLAPYVISKNSDISPLFILFAILGGISLMGPVGIIIGPLVLSLLYSLVSIYKKELKS